MVSLQWSEKLTKNYFSHPFLFDYGARLPILPYPDFHREAPIHLLVILSVVKNQMENDALRPFGLKIFLVAPVKRRRSRIFLNYEPGASYRAVG